ncbi:alcohol dehydrogenase catalytic domain-containing protein [Streptomyces sp. NBC_00199]|uniref:alcohol dehydrogenase catalytic domain-containing protein n=1 Tax=Streptomyces sp. NBC_00199 TaxID=2975678 RepID=UPI00225A2670|nr:alcohol dehydrogenase catalytic domain-containing protein [Streptomyces sp. NBC_00199]MCX5265614.1 alcohol dehydrogenase catalytic domain-containing protein [Streptomyces sp. NBC_00199]
MLASWYDDQGPAADVLHVGELPDPVPGPGEVRVRVTVSGVNPGDTKKRRGWLGSSMPYPRVIPHSDAAGVIDAVGAQVDVHRVGQRVWVYGAQSYRPFGTAAQYTVIPDHQAAPLPDHLSDELGASLGIPGITAHRTVFADGPVDGQLVLVHGVLGGVGSLAAQLAHRAGATVLATVRRTADLDRVDPAVVSHAFAQTGRRTTRLDVPPFTIDSEQGRRHWRQLLLALEQRIVLIDAYPGMLADDLSDYLFARSTGHIGSLMTLVNRGCQRAQRTGAERLTRDLLAQVRNDEAAEHARTELEYALQAGKATSRPRSARAAR